LSGKQVSEGLNLVVNLTQQDPKFHGAHCPLAAIGLAVLQHDYDEAAVAAGYAALFITCCSRV
jgi:formylmethanofuran dehydrogenase subunit E